MSVRQSKPLKVSIIVSITLHAVFFFSIIWIKIGSEYNIREKVDVSLLKSNKAKLLQRSIPARSNPLIKISSQHYSPETTVKIGLSQTPSPVISVDKGSPILFSGIDSLPYEIPKSINVQKAHNDLITRPLTTKLRGNDKKPASLNTMAIGGYKFLDNKTSMLEKPKVNIVEDNGESLRQFLTLVRKKIESKKKYPMSAKNAGIEGRSEVKLTILKDGQLEKVEVIDSSGSEILDNAALESVRNAVPFPPIPPDLRKDKIEMSIYLIFKIG